MAKRRLPKLQAPVGTAAFACSYCTGGLGQTHTCSRIHSGANALQLLERNVSLELQMLANEWPPRVSTDKVNQELVRRVARIGEFVRSLSDISLP